MILFVGLNESYFCVTAGLLGIRQPTLNRRDAVSQTEGNSLCLGSNTNVTRQLAIIVILLFHRHVDQGIFAKDAV
jgi:hypothetical protein